MKVLMFGWEFPPISSGGLGTACYGLTRSLSSKGVDISFVVPSSGHYNHSFLRLLSVSNLSVKSINSRLQPYLSSELSHSSDNVAHHTGGPQQTNPLYGAALFLEVDKYAERARLLAAAESFDLIHCHDWMTFGAGIAAKAVSGKPLIVHVHSTEFDRTGGNGLNQHVYDKEREGMHAADQIIAVSEFTKKMIVNHYNVDPAKVTVVHNAVEAGESGYRIEQDEKIVLFLGRLTLQKGPDYFLEAAKRVLSVDPSVKFIIAGSGDMEPRLMQRTAELGIGMNVLFAGFLQGDDIARAYRMADLYVMPSVSEPFGITTLESMSHGTPTLISKQSGVSEVVTNTLKADFWDIDDLADKMLGALRYGHIHQTLKDHGSFEIRKFTWDRPAQKCIDLYEKVR